MKKFPALTAMSLVLGLTLGSLSAPVDARPVTWTLTDIVFDDSSTASGTFVYDAETQTVSDVGIQTSAGAYNLVQSTSAVEIAFVTGTDINDLAGELILDLNFLGAGLTDLGGTVAVGATMNGASQERACGDPICNIQDPLRTIVGGSVVANTLSFFNGNAYEFVVDPDISWDDANSDAQALSFAGVSGHLVTIFNTAENDFVVGLTPGVDNSVWIGATDSDTEGVWRWVTGERFWQGDENGMPGPDVLFANWGFGEPNDDSGEDYALILGQDVDNMGGTFGPGTWNDLRIVGDPSGVFSIAGYVVEYELQLDSSTVILDDQDLPAEFDPVIPIILQSSEPIVSIDFDITVEYTDFGGGEGAFGSQFLLEVFTNDNIFEVIDIGTIGPAGVATCPEIVECDFDLMFGSTTGTFMASGTITSFADGRPLSDVPIDAPEQWNVGLGTFSDDFNPGGPEGVINGSVTINQLGAETGIAIVVPNAFEFIEGDANNCIPVTGCLSIDRYQQVYGSSEFADIEDQGQSFISEIRFRPDNDVVPSFPDGSFADVEIRLSTTPALFGPDGVNAIGPDNLFTTFSDNVGGDEVVVYRGPLTFTSSVTGPGPLDFDIIITLQTPFLYDPTAGNLLFEWRSYSSEEFFGAVDATFIGGDSVSRVWSTLPNDAEAPSGAADTTGIITRFTFIPAENVAVVDVPTPVGDDVPVVQVTEFFEMVAAEVVVPGTTSAFFCVGPDRRWVTDRFGHTAFKNRWLRLSELAGFGSCTGTVVEGEPETWEELLAQVDLRVAPFYRSYRSLFTKPGDDMPTEDYWVEVALVIVDGAQFNGPNSVINFPEALLDFSIAPEEERPGCDRDAEWKQLDLAGPVEEFGDFPSVDGLKMSVKTGQCNRSRGMTRRTTHAFPFRLAKDNSFEQEAIEIKHIDMQFAGIRKTLKEARSCADPSLIANMRSSLRAAIRRFYSLLQDGGLDDAEEHLEEIARSAMNSDDFGTGFTNCPVEANYHGDLLQRGISAAFAVHDRWQHPDNFVLYLLPADITVFGFASEMPPIP